MNTLLGELATLNDIQYPRYRIAFKLRKLQRDFLLDHLDVSTVQEALHLSGVGPLFRGTNVPLSQLHSSVTELYSCLRVLRPVLGSAHLKQAQELCYNWLQMNYKCSMGGKVDAGSLKITLCLLSGAKHSDKARYLFSVLANITGAVGCCDVAYFCTVTQQLAGTLHEQLYSEWAGPEELWKHCLKFVRSAEDVEDDEMDGGYIKRQWLSQFEFTKLFTSHPEPKFLKWLTLFHRIPSLEKVVHPVRCAVCTRKPIVAFRYQCTQCNNFNLCQMCFLKGRVTDKHLPSHTMVEFSSSPKQSWHHRLVGGTSGRVRGGGRVWDEPMARFLYSGRSSVVSMGHSDDHVDSSMTSIQDMMASSQQQNQQQDPNRGEDDHAHHPTMIRIGSHGSIGPQPLPHNKQAPPPPEKRNTASASDGSDGSSESISSNGGAKFNYEGTISSAGSGGDPSISSVSSNSDPHMFPVKVAHSNAPQDKIRSHSVQHNGHMPTVKVSHSNAPQDKIRSHSAAPQEKVRSYSVQHTGHMPPVKVVHSTAPQEKVRSYSVQHTGHIPPVKVSHSAAPQEKVRSHSMQHNRVPQKEKDLAEINRRLSMELDVLLSDLPAPPTAKALPLPHSVMSYKVPINQAPPLLGGSHASSKHLVMEGENLEGQVSNLTDKREQLAGELEGLISQVHSLHTKSLSLSRGIRTPSPSPAYFISPVVGPSHSRSDSLPAEAYLISSPQQGHSPLVHRKVYDPSSTLVPPHPPVLHGSHQEINEATHFPDPMAEYPKPHPEAHRLSVAW